MKIWYNNALESERFITDVVGNRVRIGRGVGNDIVLKSPYVAEEAAVLSRRGDRWELIALGLNGCEVNDSPLWQGDRIALDGSEKIKLFPFTLTLEPEKNKVSTPEERHRAGDVQTSELIRDMHVQLLSHMDLGDADDPRNNSDEYLMSLERNIDEIARLNGITAPDKVELVTHIAGQAVRNLLIERLIDQCKKEDAANPLCESHDWARLVSAVPDRERELDQVIDRMFRNLELEAVSDISEQMALVETKFWTAWDGLSGDVFEEFRLYTALRHLKKQIKDIVFGYGPLEDLLRTPTVSEIMVVSRDQIYVEKNGVVENSGRRFISDEVTLTIIERIVGKVGRRIDKSQPLVDARLLDGSRVNAVIPPLAVSGPCLTIRKFPASRLMIDDLIAMGAMSDTVAAFLRAAVIARKNILISGGTGTGKTTLLNCLSDFIPDKERIVTIEDTAELQLNKEHVVRLETKKANTEGTGAYSIHDLVKNSLRMRPERIVVGECRGAEALDMLQAMNTGHDGSLTTIHANNSADVVLRLEIMVQSAVALPVDSIHRQISSAIDLVVQLNRAKDGRRRISQVTEIDGIDEVHGGVRTKDIFALEKMGKTLELMPTGRLPSFMDELIDGDLIELDGFYR
ncbi:Putative conjugal transfer protein [Symmachiella dynata]|uniref:Conjugal transfer protein n=1 Tax=Symmachiella dynata TaxID=2527995 RepID=A0A517ZQU9_9PLAN|nr:ATPase, T2SS/T4P/T4SS family [Symmachiella dynata]QDU44871.1 Putative conjugal transfer protein [Symmachiella dynata]